MKRSWKALASALVLCLGLGQTLAAQTPLSVEIFDRAQPGFVATDNWQTKWIQAQVKAELGIDVTFVAVPRSQEVDKLNLLMAAGQAPDVSFTYSEAMVTNFAKAGGLTDLSRLLPKLAPNVQKYLGQPVLQFGQWGGKQWSIPAKRTFAGAYSGFIRQDWLDKLKLKVPTTVEELYTVLKAFKDKDPGNLGKDKVIPFAITVDSGNIQWTSSLIWEAFRNKVADNVGAAYERWNIPGHKDAVQYLNKLYNEGLLSPNFVLDKDGQQYTKDIVQGRVGAIIHNFDQLHRASPGMEVELEKTVPGAKFVPFDLQNKATKTFAKWMYNPNGFFIIVPKASKQAEAALRYLNWMAKPEVLQYLQNGTQGVQYKTVRNGIPVDFISQNDLADADKWHQNDFSILANGREFGALDKNLEALSFNYSGYESVIKQAMAISVRDGYVQFRFDRVIDAEAKYRQTLNTKGAELFVKSVTCKPADFSKTYDAILKEYMAAGGTSIETEKLAAFQAMQAEKAAADKE
jgi:putative aldouronate transport system substrate-binding protein